MRIVQKINLMWSVLILCIVTQYISKATLAQSAKPSSHQWAWINAEWKEQELPFKKIRSDLDKTAVQNKDALLLVQRYKAMVKKEPANAQAQFKWAYTTYRAATHKVAGVEPEFGPS